MSTPSLRLAALAGVAALFCNAALAQNRPTPVEPASAGSPGTVGAMQGVQPTPGTGGASTAPKLMRRTPGSGSQTQPASGAAPGGAMSPASTPMTPKPSPVGNGK